MGRSTARGGLRGFAQNLVALTIAGVALYAGLWMGMPLALFGLVVIAVCFLGYALSYCLLWLAFRGWVLRILAALSAIAWLVAGVWVGDAVYDTPVWCGPGLGQAPFREVAGSFETGLNGRRTRPCLPEARDAWEMVRNRFVAP